MIYGDTPWDYWETVLLSSFISTVSWMECDSAVLTSCYVIAIKQQGEAMIKQQVEN